MIKVVVVATETGDEETLLKSEGLLGDKEPRIGVIEMDDFIRSLIKATASSIVSPSNLKIEIGGTVYIASGEKPDEKIVCFNVLANEIDSGKEGLMKIIIKTAINPDIGELPPTTKVDDSD